VFKKAIISKSGFKKARLATMLDSGWVYCTFYSVYCELYISNIV